MDQQQPTQYYYQQNTVPCQGHIDTYRVSAQSPVPVQVSSQVSTPTPVIYQQPIQQPTQYIQQQPTQYIQQQAVQPRGECICQQSKYQPQNMTSQNRDLGDIVTSVLGDEKMKETMKDEEIKLLKAQIDLLDTKISDMIAKKVKKFCF